MMTTDDDGELFTTAAEHSDPDDQARDEGRRAVEAAILRMARAAGAQIHQRPAWPGAAACTISYVAPAAGMRYTQMLIGAARNAEHSYIRYAREQGLTWQQVGEALNLAAVAEERGASLGEAAFEHATDAGHARPFDTLTFYWTCPSCGQRVSDRGPYNGHPADCEHGHGDRCERFAAAVAAYEAAWAGED